MSRFEQPAVPSRIDGRQITPEAAALADRATSADGPPTPTVEAMAVVATQGAPLPPASGNSGNALDDRQEVLMTKVSTDGRPPTRAHRLLDWRIASAVAGIFMIGVVIWLAIRGVSLGTVMAGAAFAAILLVGALPVVGAGLMRGREERAARRVAIAERVQRSMPD